MCLGGGDFSVSPLSLVKKSHLPALFWVPARNVAAFLVHLQLLQNASIKESQRQDTVFERGEC